MTENTRKGARGFILPAAHMPGNPAKNRLLAQTARELTRAGITPREVVVDGGFQTGPTRETFSDLTDEQIHISGRQEPGSRRTRKRRARYRTGIEGRISHLKRRNGLRRSRLKGDDGMQIWTGWAILDYDLDTPREQPDPRTGSVDRRGAVPSRCCRSRWPPRAERS